MAEVLIGVGTNVGDREQNAIEALREVNRLGPLIRSKFYLTEPVGMEPGAPRFLNCVFKVWTDAPPRRVLETALAAEAKLGRNFYERKGSRPLDLDILLYDELVLNEPDLVIPHPRLHERAFVLVPLADIAADARHPVLNRTVAELLAAVSRDGVREWPRT